MMLCKPISKNRGFTFSFLLNLVFLFVYRQSGLRSPGFSFFCLHGNQFAPEFFVLLPYDFIIYRVGVNKYPGPTR